MVCVLYAYCMLRELRWPKLQRNSNFHLRSIKICHVYVCKNTMLKYYDPKIIFVNVLLFYTRSIYLFHLYLKKNYKIGNKKIGDKCPTS